MTLTLLATAGIVIAFVAVVATARSQQAAPALAGETTVVGLADSGAETLVGHGQSAGSTHAGADWNLTTVSALCDAEDLLDSLEMQGFGERELVVLGNSCFAVRWR
jgi:hypothetical protein